MNLNNIKLVKKLKINLKKKKNNKKQSAKT